MSESSLNFHCMTVVLIKFYCFGLDEPTTETESKFSHGAPGRIRTGTVRILSPRSLPLEYEGEVVLVGVEPTHPKVLDFESSAAANYATGPSEDRYWPLSTVLIFRANAGNRTRDYTLRMCCDTTFTTSAEPTVSNAT